MADLILSARVAGRMFAKRPALSWARVLTVTIVVTAVAAVFTVTNATLLRPLPFPEGDRLVRVYFQPPGTTDFSAADSLDAFAFVRFRAAVRTMDAMVGIFVIDRAVSGLGASGEPESILAGRVSSGFFRTLGGDAALGRTFTDEEFAIGSNVVVLSDGFWQRQFGADPAIVGRVLTVDREPYTIVGVTKPAFDPGFTEAQFFTPFDLRNPNPLFSGVETIGRLRPGATPAQAFAELNAILPDVAKEFPDAFRGWTMGAVDLREAQYGSKRPTILMLLATVLGLALLATANLTNLTIADVMARSGDFATRAALGGSRLEIARAEIVQATVIAVLGGSLGLAAASWLAPALLRLDPSNVITPAQLVPDWRVFTCGFGLALLIMVTAVALPVIRSSGPDAAQDLTVGARRAIGGRAARRLRTTLVIVQTALGIVLLAAGAMIVRTLDRTAAIDPGFDPTNVITARVRFSEIALPTTEARGVFLEKVLQRLRETPGIVSVSTTLNWFVPGSAGAKSLAFVEDRPNPDGAPYRIQSRRTTAGYFATMRARILQGRDFTEHDRLGSPPVAIVSRSLAERFWPGQDALGRHIKRGVTTKEWATVVGVADDIRDVSMALAPQDTLYTAFLQSPVSPLPVTLVIRTGGEPKSFVKAIKQAVWDIDRNQPLANVVTLDQFLDESLGEQKFRSLLVAGYALLGVILATIGIYGVTARSVVERTKEVGVRLALGGSPSRVWVTVASDSFRAVAAGALVGIGVSALSAAALAALLPELGSGVWRYGFGAATALTAAGCAAALLAARRVVSMEPSRALLS